MKKKTPHNIESIHRRLKTKKLGSMLSVSVYGTLIDKHNHTPRRILGGLSPFEYCSQQLQYKTVNERSPAAIVKERGIPVERTLTRGGFSYNGQLYRVRGCTLIGAHNVVIWIDPGQKMPPRIKVDLNGAPIGDATLVPDRGTCQLDGLGKKTKHRKAT